MHITVNKSKIIITLDVSFVILIVFFFLTLFLPIISVNSQSYYLLRNYSILPSSFLFQVGISLIILFLFIIFYLINRLFNLPKKVTTFYCLLDITVAIILLLTTLTKYDIVSIVIGQGLLLTGLLLSMIDSIIIMILLNNNHQIKTSLRSIINEYFEMIKSLVDKMFNVSSILTFLILILSLIFQNFLPNYGSFLNFTDGALLVIILWTINPFNYFLNINETKKSIKLKFYQLISILQNALIIILIVLAISSIKLNQLLNKEYLDRVIRNFSVYNFLFIFIFMFIILLTANLFNRYWESKTNRITEFLSLLIVLFTLVILIVIFGNPFTHSPFTPFFFTILIFIILLMLLPWSFQYNTFLKHVYNKKKENSFASKLSINTTKILEETFRNQSEKQINVNFDKLSEIYISSLIYKYVDEWMTKYIGLSIIILAFLSTINFIQNLIIPLELNGISKITFPLIMKIIVILTIYFGTNKIDSTNKNKTSEIPNIVKKGDASKLISLLYSKTNILLKMAILIIFFSFPAFVIIIFTYMIAAESNLLVLDGIFVYIMILDLIFSFTGLILSQKKLIPNFVEYYNTGKDQNQTSPILLFLAPLSMVAPFIPLLFRSNLQLSIYLEIIHICVMILILLVYNLINIKQEIGRKLEIEFLLSSMLTIILGFIFMYTYMSVLIALIVGGAIILVSFFSFQNLKSKIDEIKLSNLKEKTNKGWDEVWTYLKETIEFKTRPAAFYEGKKIKIDDYLT